MKSTSADNIKKKIHEKEEADFFDYFAKHLQKRIDQDKIGTHDKERVILNKLKDFTKRNRLLFKQIDVKFLERFERYLESELSNSANTINGNFRVIRMLFNNAQRFDVISPIDNPFNKFKIISKVESKRVYLLEDEVSRIKELDLNSNTTINHHRQMFLFACYACGIRVSDLLLLSWSSVQKNHIEISTRKTPHHFKFKLLDGAQEILKEYKEITGKRKICFPIF